MHEATNQGCMRESTPTRRNGGGQHGSDNKRFHKGNRLYCYCDDEVRLDVQEIIEFPTVFVSTKTGKVEHIFHT